MNYLFILPTTLRCEEKLKELTITTPSIFNYKIFTLQQFIDKVFYSVNTTLYEINQLQEYILLKKIVHSYYKKKSGYFSQTFNNKGFIENLYTLFVELKHAKVDSMKFQEVAKNEPENNKWQELATLYHNYDNYLKSNNLVNNLNKAYIVLEVLKDKSKKLELLDEVDEVTIEDIYDPTPLQFDIIVALADRFKNAKVTIPYNPDRQDAFRFLEEEIRKFEGLSDKITVFDPFDMFSVKVEGGSTLLYNVLNYIFKPPKELINIEKFEKDATIEILEAFDINSEIRGVARYIKRLLTDNVPPDRIGVIIRDIADYETLIHNIFTKFGIDIYPRQKLNLASNYLTRTILTLFPIINSNYKTEQLLKFVTSYYTKFKEKEIIEKKIYEQGIIDDELTPYKKYLPNKELLKFIGTLKRFQKDNSLAEFVQQLKTIIESYITKELNAEEKEALSVFNELLEEIVSLTKMANISEKITIDDFYQIIIKGLSKTYFTPPNIEKTGIKLLTPYDAIGLSFDYLFICCLIEDNFPKRIFENPIFLDDEKISFNKLIGYRVFRSIKLKFWEEPLLFYLSLTTARKRVYLSYHKIDREGKETITSTFLEAVTNLIKDSEKIIIKLPHLLPEINDIYEKEELLTKAFFNVYHRSDDLLSYAIYQKFNLFPKDVATTTRFTLREEAINLNNEILQDIITNYVYNVRWPPTRLEEYIRCPFQFFLKEIIKLRRLEQNKIELNPKLEGDIVHRILKEVYQESKKLKKDVEVLLEEVANKVFEEEEKKEHLGLEGFLDIKKRQILRRLKRFFQIYKDDAFIPYKFEFEFPEINIDNNIKITGKIDRIDIKDDRVRIIDYKYSRNLGEPVSANVEKFGKTTFQLPIYMLAVYNDEYLKSKKKYEGVFYLLKAKQNEMRVPSIKNSLIIDKEKLEEIKQVVFEGIRKIVNKIEKGEFPPAPFESETCKFCDYRRICK